MKKDNYVEKFHEAVEKFGKRFYELRNHSMQFSKFYSVDDEGTIHVKWDLGCSLGIIYGVYSCVKISEREEEQ